MDAARNHVEDIVDLQRRELKVHNVAWIAPLINNLGSDMFLFTWTIWFRDDGYDENHGRIGTTVRNFIQQPLVVHSSENLRHAYKDYVNRPSVVRCLGDNGQAVRHASNPGFLTKKPWPMLKSSCYKG